MEVLYRSYAFQWSTIWKLCCASVLSSILVSTQLFMTYPNTNPNPNPYWIINVYAVFCEPDLFLIYIWMGKMM